MQQEPALPTISMKGDNHLAKIVSAYYDIGELVNFELITKATANISYKIETSINGKKTFYLLRRYREDNSASQINFEHAILIELRRRNFRLSPKVILTRSGSSYIKAQEAPSTGSGTEAKVEFYVTIFGFLPGEDKYNWHDASPTGQELASAANTLALYHGAIAGWEHEHATQSSFVDQMPRLVSEWGNYINPTSGEMISTFDRYLIESYPYLKTLSVTLRDRALSQQLDKLPTITIHGDYHPGNLLFLDGQVTALLDFDHARTDARSLDIAFALFYSCCVWGGTADGELNLEKTQLFLTAYQQAWRVQQGATVKFYPLTEHELQSLPDILLMRAFWSLDWVIKFYCTNKHDPERWLAPLRHGIRTIKWVEAHRVGLAEVWRASI